MMRVLSQMLIAYLLFGLIAVFVTESIAGPIEIGTTFAIMLGWPIWMLMAVIIVCAAVGAP